MRKAHEAEVQKEVTKFKTEFLKKIQSNHDIGALHKEHECVLHDRHYRPDMQLTNDDVYFECLELKWKKSKKKFCRCPTSTPSNALSRRTLKKN